MAISPWFVGDTYQPFQPTLLFDNGTAPNFTGATAVITFKNSETGVTWTSTPANFTLSGASFSYLFAAQDVATAGKYKLSIRVTFANGSSQTWDNIPWEVRNP